MISFHVRVKSVFLEGFEVTIIALKNDSILLTFVIIDLLEYVIKIKLMDLAAFAC
jgi:hypothetical protein